jgi:hypothetical protein
MSSPRRVILLGIVVAAGALSYSVLDRRDTSSHAVAGGGDFSVCAKQEGDTARTCYSRKVGRELAAVGGGSSLPVSFVAPSDTTGEVTFTSAGAEAAQEQSVLCDLHTRVGVTDEQVPSWLGWTEPLAEASPVS